MIIFRYEVSEELSMRILILTGLALSIFAFSSLSAATRAWPVGVEREVDEGFYFTLLAVNSGWRFWKMETSSGIRCMAVKSAVGQPHPVPLGVGGAFFEGTPFVTIYEGYKTSYAFSWNAEHYGKVGVKIRKSSDKFWMELNSTSEDLTKFADEIVELSVTSWEYPEIYVGHSEEKGSFNFVGLTEAIKFVSECKIAK